MSQAYTPITEPPKYDQAPKGQTSQGANYGEQSSRSENDHVPNDFKFDTIVSSCDLEIRHLFVRKVYSLLTLQMLITFVVGAVIYFNEGVRDWCLTNMWPFYMAIAGSMIFMGLAFWKRRSYPYNIMLLVGFTLCESYMVGLVTSLYDTNVVLQAVLITTVVFLSVTMFSFQSKYDFTQWQGVLSMVFFGFFSVGLVSLFMPFNSSFEFGYSILGALLFTCFILVDTQMIMRKFHPEEEVAATIMLYLDIINLFLYILRIVSNDRD